MPGDREDEIHLQANHLNNPGDKVVPGIAGDWYHILLFKEDKDGFVENYDDSEAVLIDPLEYMSMLIPNGWYGVVCKKTTISDEVIDDIVDKFFTN
jgi:hypothetical protein